MNCSEKDYRSFSHNNEAWYSKAVQLPSGVQDQIYFGLSCGGGGTHGEMKMEWTELGGKSIPQLCVYDDGWEILASFTDLLAELAKANCSSMSMTSITPKQFCEMLLRCGFKDETQRENPYPVPPKQEPTSDEMRDALLSIAYGRFSDGPTIARKALGIEP